MNATKAYAVIRLAIETGHEWIDPSTVQYCSQQAASEANATAAYIPHWAVGNPVLRISRVAVIELDTLEDADLKHRLLRARGHETHRMDRRRGPHDGTEAGPRQE